MTLSGRGFEAALLLKKFTKKTRLELLQVCARGL
jgi:hypothetical protein